MHLYAAARQARIAKRDHEGLDNQPPPPLSQSQFSPCNCQPVMGAISGCGDGGAACCKATKSESTRWSSTGRTARPSPSNEVAEGADEFSRRCGELTLDKNPAQRCRIERHAAEATQPAQFVCTARTAQMATRQSPVALPLHADGAFCCEFFKLVIGCLGPAADACLDHCIGCSIICSAQPDL